MSIEHLPKPADVLPLDIQIALRLAVANRFDESGVWIKPQPYQGHDQQSSVARIDKIVAQARKQYPKAFRKG